MYIFSGSDLVDPHKEAPSSAQHSRKWGVTVITSSLQVDAGLGGSSSSSSGGGCSGTSKWQQISQVSGVAADMAAKVSTEHRRSTPPKQKGSNRYCVLRWKKEYECWCSIRLMLTAWISSQVLLHCVWASRWFSGLERIHKISVRDVCFLSPVDCTGKN